MISCSAVVETDDMSESDGVRDGQYQPPTHSAVGFNYVGME